MAKQNNTKVVTGIVRLSYANVWEPKSINGGDPKYSCSIIIPKSDIETVNAINAAIECAMKEGIGKFGGKIPPKGALKLPLRDGDTERDDDNYAGCYFINANSKTAPQIKLIQIGHDVQIGVDTVSGARVNDQWIGRNKIKCLFE